MFAVSEMPIKKCENYFKHYSLKYQGGNGSLKKLYNSEHSAQD